MSQASGDIYFSHNKKHIFSTLHVYTKVEGTHILKFKKQQNNVKYICGYRIVIVADFLLLFRDREVSKKLLHIFFFWKFEH